ncbi:MAG: DUF2184 domain-containing protein [Pseudomonadota bacterium]|nr:DUF2184 domain-containing protein [Pseudomonadota bacterium]
MSKAIFQKVARDYGIVFPGAMDMLPKGVAHDINLAMDAQPNLVTVSSAGIPYFLSNYIDPEFINVMVTPMNAVKIFGETKKGDWTTMTTMFPIAESTGEVSSYGDYSNNGSVNSNTNYVNRQSYQYQTVTQWGERELEMAGLGKIDKAAQLNVASALALAKFANKSYFFGIAHLENYGLLNDPSLPAALTPATKTAGGTTWAVATAAEIYTDIQAMYAQAQVQLKGLVTRESPFVLAMAPEIEAQLTKTNTFNVNVIDQIKKNFPNARIETAVEYDTTGGELVQMIFDDVEGQDTGYCAFGDKMRAHPVVVDLSSFKQKKSASTWGAIVRLPLAIVQMLGV